MESQSEKHCLLRRSSTLLTELRNAFIRTLKLTDDQIISPENSHLFAAISAAMNSKVESRGKTIKPLQKLYDGIQMDFEVQRMQPLFKNESEYQEFTKKHSVHTIKKAKLSEYEGNCFLGIDAGSTTTKVALVGKTESTVFLL